MHNGQVEKPAIFGYEQLKSKNTEIESLHDAYAQQSEPQ